MPFRQHPKRTQSNIIDNPVRFWAYIKDKKKVRRPVDAYTYDGIEVSGQAAADAFAKYFSSVFQVEIRQLDTVEAAKAVYVYADSTVIAVITVDEADFKLAAKRMKTRSAGGPDGIPVFLVKDCLSTLCAPLLYIFNLCLRRSQYPMTWKTSRVIPVPKGESGMNVLAFRPIAVLPVFAKLFEAILNQRISSQICYHIPFTSY